MWTKRLAFRAAALIGAVSLGAWVYFSPYLTVWQMRRHAEAGDSPALSQHVNFPALRESVKATLMATMSRSMKKDELRDSPFAAFGAMLAMSFIGPMVDMMVSPEGVAMMMQGERPKPTDGASRRAPADKPSAKSPSDVEFVQGYEGYDRFSLAVREKNVEQMALVFHREGLVTWKLASLRLHLDD
jgi:hypothetical protein